MTNLLLLGANVLALNSGFNRHTYFHLLWRIVTEEDEEEDTSRLYSSVSWTGFNLDTSPIMWDTWFPVITVYKHLGTMPVH